LTISSIVAHVLAAGIPNSIYLLPEHRKYFNRSQSRHFSGQQVQRIYVSRSDYGKVTAIQRRHIGQPKPFGYHDN